MMCLRIEHHLQIFSTNMILVFREIRSKSACRGFLGCGVNVNMKNTLNLKDSSRRTGLANLHGAWKDTSPGLTGR